jgi:hypothetical protein
LKIKIAPDSEFSHFRELAVSAGNELNSYLSAAMFALCADERLKTGPGACFAAANIQITT